MKRSAGRLVAGLGRRAVGVGDRLLETEQARRCRPWFAVDGDRTLRFAYDLDESSVVLDIGGYEGQWASDLFGRFGCTIHVFEAVPSYAEAIARRFEHNPRVHVHAVALADRDGTAVIALDDDRSSMFTGSGGEVEVRLVRAADHLASLGIDTIDLAKLNIEGAEYDLLDHLLDTGVVPRIRDLQIQFHDVVDDAAARMRRIQQRLAETHEPSWQFEFVWESWHRRDG